MREAAANCVLEELRGHRLHVLALLEHVLQRLAPRRVRLVFERELERHLDVRDRITNLVRQRDRLQRDSSIFLLGLRSITSHEGSTSPMGPKFLPTTARQDTIDFMRLLLAVALACVMACSDPPNVGATCTASGGCDEGLTCETGAAGGYCTKACTMPGSTEECPEGSICDAIIGSAMACVKICKDEGAGECRSDQSCNGTTNGSTKACKPK